MSEKTNGLTKGRTNEIDRLVSKKLKIRRLLLGFTQQELSKSIAVSIQQVQKYENATNRISCGQLYNIAEFLKISVGYFFDQAECANYHTNYNLAEDQEEYESLIFNNSQNNNKLTKRSNFIKNSNNLQLSSHEKDIITLTKFFKHIQDSSIRKKIIDLVKTLGNRPFV